MNIKVPKMKRRVRIKRREIKLVTGRKYNKGSGGYCRNLRCRD
jgi:hypothetical protein